MSFCKPMTRLVRDDAAAAFGLLSVSTNTEATITNTITSVRSAIERDRKKLISLSSSRSRIGRPKGANRIKRYVRVTFASGQTRGRRVFPPGVATTECLVLERSEEHTSELQSHS